MCTWIASHLSSLPMATCFGKGHYHSLLMSEAHALETFLVAMGTMPCPILTWCNNKSWRCTHDSSSMHKALSPCIMPWFSFIVAASKQQTMILCSWLFKTPCPRHCTLVSLSGGKSASHLVPLWPRVAHYHTLWSLHVGVNEACPMFLARVGGLALRPSVVATSMPPWVTYPLLPLRSISGHFRCFWKRHHIYLKMNNGFIE